MDRLHRLVQWIAGVTASRGVDASVSPASGARSALGPYRAGASRREIAVLCTARQFLGGFTADAAWVYMVDGPVLHRLAPEGGEPKEIARFESPAVYLAIGADHLYIGGFRSVSRTPKQGRARDSVAERERAVRDSAAWGTYMGGVEEGGETEPTNDETVEQHHSWVIAAPLGEGEPVTLAYRPHKIDGLFADGEAVYWVERRAAGAEALMAVSPSGGTPVERMTFVRSDRSWRFAAAMDARLIYWTDASAKCIFATPRHGSSHYRLVELGAMPLALTAEGGALYALAGDPSKPRREVLQISPSDGTVNLLAHFDVGRPLQGGGYPEGRLAASAAGLFAHDGTRLLAIG